MAIIKENSGDASADTQTQYIISLGDVFQGTLDRANDKDWIRVELDADIIYDITLSGVEPAQLQLSDSAGYSIVTGGEFPSGAKLIFSPPVSGTYYIHVGSYDDGFTGDYELSLAENTIPLGTYDEIAEFLTDGSKEWQGGSRFAFGDIVTANIRELTQDGQQLARWAFEAWTNVTGIEFRFVDDDDADITFDDDVYTGEGGTSITTIVNGIIKSHVNVHTSNLLNHGVTIDSPSFTTYLHEIGHALGLGHPGPYNLSPFYYGYHNIFLIDSMQATLMSYAWQHQNTYIDASVAHPITPMIADIIAIQDLYGVPTDINIGDTVYGYHSNVDGYLGQFFKLWTGELNPFINIGLVDYTSSPTIKPTLTDLDGDSDPDLVVGSRGGAIHYFENTGTSANPGFTEHIGTDNPLDGVTVGSYSTPSFTDLDGDGDLDLIVGNGDGDIAYFENTGTVPSPSFTQRTGADNPFDTITKGSWSTVALADLDGDGDLDLAVGINDGDVHYYENTGTSANPNFISRTGETSPLNNINAGSYSTPVFVDFDDDNDPDLVVGSGNENIYYFENTGTTTEPSFIQRTDFDNPFHGANGGGFVAPEFADLNGDGDLDLIIGNQVGDILYYKNTGTDANPEFSPQSLTGPTTFTIYDNGGNDTLDLRTDKDDQRIYLRPEGISDVYGLTGNLIIARDTWIENFIAGSGDDLIAGNAVANYLQGRDGNDRIWGSGGDDILEGGAGADRLDGDGGMDWVSYQGSDAAVTVNLAEATLSGGHAEGDILTEIENVIGSDYEDVLVGNDEANRLEGGAGADRLDGGGGIDWVSYQLSDAAVTVNLAEGAGEGGDAQGDVITHAENVTGSAHGDVLWGDDNANRLEGAGGDDQLGGRGGDDVLAGGDGDDLLFGSTGADRLEGGAGYDVLTYERSDAGVTINLGAGTQTGSYAQGDLITGIEQVVGSDYRDVLTGDDEANVLNGIGGDDELRGNDGDDVLEGGAGADRLDGGAGVDRVSYIESDTGVTVNLSDNTAAGGHAQGDVLTEIENMTGSRYQDVLTGDNSANELYGHDGDDELQGNGGDDVLEGGAGADQLDGGAGTDWLSYAGSDGAVSVRLYDGYARRGHAEGDVISGFENLRGSDYADRLAGTGRANQLEGGAGNDQLRGSSGDDVLEGGAGADGLSGGRGIDTISYRSSDTGVTVNLKEGTSEGGHADGDTITEIENIAGSGYRDVLVGDDGANSLNGDAGDDELKGGIGVDRLDGNLGDDWLYGGNGADELRGGEGNDRLFGEVGDDDLYGNVGDDELHGGDDNDQLFGGVGDDRLYGDVGDDELHGDENNDRLSGNAGADRLDGGSGIDWVSYQESDAGVTVDLTEGTGEGGHAQGDVLTSIENATGSDYNDAISGDNGANHLEGGDGDDHLLGGKGNDLLDGGDGSDWIFYGSSDAGVTVNLEEGTGEGGDAEGDVIIDVENIIGSNYEDVLIGNESANILQGLDGNDELRGGGGQDTLDGSAGSDRLDGGDGTDWIFYWSSDAGVTVNLEEGTGEGGDAEGDLIIDVENVQGSYYRDVLIGNESANTLQGLDGNDELRGGGGQDTLDGSAGSDRLDGGDGTDWISYWSSDAGVTVNLEEGTGEGGDAEGDLIIDVENVQGSYYRDVLIGNESANSLQGLDGNDELRGNSGDDWLDGGGGADSLYGDEGSDIFIFNAGHGDDTIIDFTNDDDQIDLSSFNLSGFDELTISSVSNDVEIDLSEHGGGTILLQNFEIGDLDATDFLF